MKHFQHYQYRLIDGSVSLEVGYVSGDVWVDVSIVKGGVWADISLRGVFEKVVISFELHKSLGLKVEVFIHLSDFSDDTGLF